MKEPIAYTTASEVPHAFTRFYHGDPEEKSPGICYAHGADHRAYGWCPQLDPRWHDVHVEFYCAGFNGTELP